MEIAVGILTPLSKLSMSVLTLLSTEDAALCTAVATLWIRLSTCDIPSSFGGRSKTFRLLRKGISVRFS